MTWKKLITFTWIVAVVLQCASCQCQKQTNKDINGGQALKSIHGQLESKCCQLCTETAGCKAYAWNDYLGGTCWLKSAAGPVIDKWGVSIGIINQGPEGTHGGHSMVSYQEFSNALTSNGYPGPSQTQYNAFSTQAQPVGGISNKRELAMFLAQVIHESGGLQFVEEIACKDTKCPNEYNAPGGSLGKYYYGRGYIQLTWVYNYKAASQALYGDDRLVQNPDQVAQNENIAWATAFWYWKANVHSNEDVQRGKFGAATNLINGAIECRGNGQNNARNRFEKYKKVLTAFHLIEHAQEGGCYN